MDQGLDVWLYSDNVDEGDYVFTAIATDVSDNVSDESDEFDVTIDLTSLKWWLVVWWEIQAR